jgi:hypothetical protein
MSAIYNLAFEIQTFRFEHSNVVFYTFIQKIVGSYTDGKEFELLIHFSSIRRIVGEVFSELFRFGIWRVRTYISKLIGIGTDDFLYENEKTTLPCSNRKV